MINRASTLNTDGGRGVMGLECLQQEPTAAMALTLCRPCT